MASAPYFDDIEGSLNKLPEELQRNFTLMLDLDSKSQNLMTDIDKMAEDYMSNIKNYSVQKQKEIMESIQSKFNSAKEFSDDKVQISIQNYALVDKRIRNLDIEISKFEKQIQLKADINKTAPKAKRYTNPKKGGSKIKSALPTASGVTDPSNPTISVDHAAVASKSAASVANSAYIDMPIDPNEPTFCLCNQVSFGEMIGCDNPECGIEWFHFKCVSLITKPEGKWFCSNCMKDMKNK